FIDPLASRPRKVLGSGGHDAGKPRLHQGSRDLSSKIIVVPDFTDPMQQTLVGSKAGEGAHVRWRQMTLETEEDLGDHVATPRGDRGESPEGCQCEVRVAIDEGGNDGPQAYVDDFEASLFRFIYPTRRTKCRSRPHTDDPPAADTEARSSLLWW